MDIQHHPADDHRPRLLLHRRVAAQRILRQRRKRSSSGKEKRNQGGAVNDPSERRGECHLSWVAHTGRRGGGRRRWRRTASILRLAGSAMSGGRRRLWRAEPKRETRIPAAVGGERRRTGRGWLGWIGPRPTWRTHVKITHWEPSGVLRIWAKAQYWAFCFC